MAKVVDPDQLEQNVSVTITPGTSGTIQLIPGGGSYLKWHDGVTLQCVYSFLKEEWKEDPNLIKYPFPMIAITEEQFELINNWNWANLVTKRHLRDGGWALKSPDGDSKEEYCNITTLGSFNENTDRGYYVQSTPTSSGTPSGFFFRNEVNEAVQIYGVAEHFQGHPAGADYTDNFVAFLREQADTYAKYDLLTEQNIAALTYKKYAMPLSSTSDSVKITHTDSEIGGGGVWANVDISYYKTKQAREIGGVNYNFHVIIEGDGQTAETIYEKVQYLLRQDSDINENTPPIVRGDIADTLLQFTGDTLATKYVEGWGGTYIDNYDLDDINRLEFYDDTNTKRTEPYTATGSLLFNDNLTNDADAKYWMFFTSVPDGSYATSGAICVRDTNSNGISGYVSAAVDGAIAYSFAYDTNDQGGRTIKTNADVTVVAIGLETAQFVKTTGTITRSTGNNISMVAALERNYSNPE